jgi:hypothetical protein
VVYTGLTALIVTCQKIFRLSRKNAAP